ncbi:MAG: sulfite exporter TauE/SafE family protein, partial [Sphingomonadales bacterium]
MEQLYPIILALAVSGLLAGFLAGLMGIGGGIVTVPILYFALGIIGAPAEAQMHITVATSLAVIVPTAIFSSRAHAKRDALDWALIKSWGPTLGLGAVIGTFTAAQVSSAGLVGFFAVMAAVMGLKLILPLENKVLAAAPPLGIAGKALSALVGGFSSLMGIGGATFSVPLMTLFSMPIHRAVGTASLLGLIIALPAVLGYIWAGWGAVAGPGWTLGYVNLAGFIIIAPLSSMMAPLGAAAAHAISRRLLSVVFGIFLLIAAT